MNVLFVSGIGGDSQRYRCIHHQEQLALCGIASELRAADDLRLYVDATRFDLYILQRVPYTPLIEHLIEIAHLRDKPIVFETDDLVFQPELYEEVGLLDTMGPEEARRFRHDLAAITRTYQQSDYFLVTTQYLHDKIQAEEKTVYIHRNGCSAEMMTIGQDAYERHVQIRSDDDGIVLGYFSGTGSHNRDFGLITPALIKILKGYPRVGLHLSGHLDIDPAFLPYSDRIRRAPYVSWRELPFLVAQVDVNLAPLELDNPFTQGKSEIKYTEAALVGVPTIASPVPAFRHAICDGETGLLAGTDEEWYNAIQQLIESPEKRHGVGEAARRRVYADYSPQVRSAGSVQILEEITYDFASPTVNHADVPYAIATAMLDQITRLSQQVQEQADQLDQLNRMLPKWSEPPQDSLWRQEWEKTEQLYADELKQILARLQRNHS